MDEIDNKDITEQLFFKIFRNKYLLNEIFIHLNLYKEYHSRFYSSNMKNFKYRGYINKFKGFISKNVDALSYYPELTSLEFAVKYNRKIEPNFIPKTVKEIKFLDEFDKELQAGSIHESVEFLELGQQYNHPPKKDILSNSITNLIFRGGFKSIDQQLFYLPNSLTNLYLGYAFEGDISILPDTITSLTLIGFDKPLIKLPKNLKQLYLRSFNQPIDKDTFINTQLNKLVLCKFDQSLVPCGFPNTLECLEFTMCFNQIIKQGDLPESLKYLKLSEMFNKDFVNDDCLPNSIESLKLGNSFTSQLFFPKSLTSLSLKSLNCKMLSLPNTLKVLSLKRCHIYNENDLAGKFPDSILKFKMPAYHFPIEVGMIPKNVTNLIYNYHNYLDPIAFPPSVTSLMVPDRFKLITLSFFSNLKELLFSPDSKFNQKLCTNSLPETLIKLEFGNYWTNGDTDLLEPNVFHSIQILKFGSYFKLSLKHNGILPNSLTKLTIPKEYHSKILDIRRNDYKFKLILTRNQIN